MSGFVVDASVAIKWLVDEPLSEQAAKLLASDLPLAAPELIYAEAANALWAMARRGEHQCRRCPRSARPAGGCAADDTWLDESSSWRRQHAWRTISTIRSMPACILPWRSRNSGRSFTADRRFYAAVQDHPYLAGQVVMLESLA